jgi:cytochrome c oxidase assembly protein subunit 11
MQKNNLKVVVSLLAVVLMMFGFCFAIVPLYNAYCKVTGINTSLTLTEFEKIPDLTRSITIQFTAINNANLPWEFYPLKSSITMHPGENAKMEFYVKNNTNRTMTIQAIPSYAPVTAPRYLHKIECFCFQQQTLRAGEEKWMPVVLHLDKMMPGDIQTISLAYTLFDVTQKRISA